MDAVAAGGRKREGGRVAEHLTDRAFAEENEDASNTSLVTRGQTPRARLETKNVASRKKIPSAREETNEH